MTGKTIEELKNQKFYNIRDLLDIMSILRSENGCPWDREQTSYSVRQSLLEESCEAIDAIEKNDTELIKEELGDVLFQVVFQSQLYQEEDKFDFNSVCDAVSKKMIERHPHVFGKVSYSSLDEQLSGWEDIKNSANGDTPLSAIDKIPNTLPALMKAQKLVKRAHKAELKLPENTIGDYNENKIGELLFSICRFCQEKGIDSESELREFTNKIKNDLTK